MKVLFRASFAKDLLNIKNKVLLKRMNVNYCRRRLPAPRQRGHHSGRMWAIISHQEAPPDKSAEQADFYRLTA